MPLQQGIILQGRYRIARLIKAGGFGTVYRAWDTNLNVACAVKENLENTPEAQNQFIREAQMLAQLNHPNLPRVIDHFIIPGQGQYLIMDFIEGEDLEAMRIQQNGALPVSQVLPWIEQVCDALTYLHSQNPPIIHRDIKPANIRITPQGKAVLVDFGIAKQWQTGQRTTIGARAVTPGYSPPEQYGGLGSTDTRSDVYSLGVTLYVLLTGREYPESVQRLSMPNTNPLPANTLNPQVPLTVSNAIQVATHIQQDQRFFNVRDFQDALHHSTARTVRVYAGSRVPKGALGVGVAALVVIGLGVGLGVGMSLFSRLTPTPLPPRTAISGGTAVVPSTPALMPTATTAQGWQATSTTAPTQAHYPTLTPWLLPSAEPSNTATAKPSATSEKASGTSSSITLDSVMIAYSKGPVGKADVYIADANGQNSTCVSCEAKCDETEPDWSPDGNLIVYQKSCTGNYDLWLYNRTTKRNAVLVGASTSEREAHFSPDGRIIFQRLSKSADPNSNGQFIIRDLSTSGETPLGISGRSPNFSPDGSQLVYVKKVADTWRVFVYDFSSRSEKERAACSPNCRFPTWSPDGNYLSFSIANKEYIPQGIVSMPSGGGSYKPIITTNGAGRPSWSRSGWIFFNNDTGIERIRPDGSGQKQLINDPNSWGPSVSQ